MIDSEARLAERLRRMQWLATGLVAAMAIVFVVTSFWRREIPALNLVWAFSEAALIGGLADWFAVTALFRHPLGLPIPHTAIVPTRKNEIGQALAGFIAQHFLVREAIEARLSRVDLSTRLGHWIEKPENAANLSRDLAIAIDWLMRSTESGALRESVKASLRELADSLPAHTLFATVIDVLASGNHTQELIDILVDYGRDQLDRSKLEIRMRIKDKSPWWLPKFVDEEIYDQLVSELERILREVGDDPSHKARANLNERLKSLKYSLGHDEELIAKGESLQREILNHPDVNRFIAEIWHRTREFLHLALSDPNSDIRQGLERELQAIGNTLASDPEVGAKLNQWLRELIVYVVENYRGPISQIISETIAEWDATATAERIELHIGRDLQFIRINGTLVGGLVGVVLYLAWSGIAG